MLTNLFKQRLMPAVTFLKEDDVLPVTEAMLQGGLKVMEVTFRTEIAAKAIVLIRKNFPEMNIGAGTLLSPEQISMAINAGAMFGLAPGLNTRVVQFAAESAFPFIPGIITASELENALALGCQVLKLFPCDLAGGVSLIKALLGPYAHTGVKLIPMGGINLLNLHEYIDLEMVLALGGSWIATSELMAQKKYDHIRKNAERSVEIVNLGILK